MVVNMCRSRQRLTQTIAFLRSVYSSRTFPHRSHSRHTSRLDICNGLSSRRQVLHLRPRTMRLAILTKASLHQFIRHRLAAALAQESHRNHTMALIPWDSRMRSGLLYADGTLAAPARMQDTFFRYRRGVWCFRFKHNCPATTRPFQRGDEDCVCQGLGVTQCRSASVVPTEAPQCNMLHQATRLLSLLSTALDCSRLLSTDCSRLLSTSHFVAFHVHRTCRNVSLPHNHTIAGGHSSASSAPLRRWRFHW